MAFVLALSMVVAMNASALAAEIRPMAGTAAAPEPPYQIDIYPNKYTATPGDSAANSDPLWGRFKAYQVFKGDVKAYDGTTITPPGTTPGAIQDIKPGKLANVGWGSNIPTDGANRAALLAALVNDPTTLAELGITTLTGAYDTAQCKTMGDLFATALTTAKYTVAGNSGSKTVAVAESGDTTTFDKAAAVVADVLAYFTTQTTNQPKLAEAFGKVVINHLTGDPEGTSEWNGTDKRWQIGSTTKSGNGGTEYVAGTDKLAGGYYIIKDIYGGNGTNLTTADTSSSDLLVGVMGDVDVYVKSSAPTVKKEIANPGNGNAQYSDFETGETINFKLTGTMPENFVNYDKYEITFHDTMDPGLSYLPEPDGIVVTVANPLYDAVSNNGVAQTIDLTIAKASFNTAGVTVTAAIEHGTPISATHSLDVAIADLKATGFETALNAALAALGDSYDEKSVDIDSISKVAVTYNAYLNGSTVLGDTDLTGDKNTVYMQYSSNPTLNTATERTIPETVHVYDFGFDLHKYNGSMPGEPALAGAGFAMTKVVSNTTYYAILDRTNAGDGDTAASYTLAGWISEDNLKALLTADSVDAITSTQWGTGIAGSSLTADKVVGGNGIVGTTTYYIAAVTPDSGDLHIVGLEDGSYTLTEVIVPTGFDTAKPITVQYTVEYYTEETLTEDEVTNTKKPGMLRTVTATVTMNGVATPYKIVEKGEYVKISDGEDGQPGGGDDVYYTDLVASFGVANYPAMWAPGTGGMGTTLIYIAGGAMLLGAVTLLILTNRKKDGKRAK